MSGILFEDIFDIKDVDPEGKQFDRGKIFSMHKTFRFCLCHAMTGDFVHKLKDMCVFQPL